MVKSKTKNQTKPGSIIEIDLSEGKLAFGRLLPGLATRISVYDYLTTKNSPQPTFEELVKKPVLFHCVLFQNIVLKGIFRVIGFHELTQFEIDCIPPSFTQDLVNIDECEIYWIDGRQRKAMPRECIGLERSSIWDEQGIKQRIEDHYNNKKNYHVELDKVILSKADPRYLPPPQALRWDFERQEFYRTDRNNEAIE